MSSSEYSQDPDQVKSFQAAVLELNNDDQVVQVVRDKDRFGFKKCLSMVSQLEFESKGDKNHQHC